MKNDKLLDINSATKKELLKEYEDYVKFSSNYYYDCMGYYIKALHNRIVELGGWPIK